MTTSTTIFSNGPLRICLQRSDLEVRVSLRVVDGATRTVMVRKVRQRGGSVGARAYSQHLVTSVMNAAALLSCSELLDWMQDCGFEEASAVDPIKAAVDAEFARFFRAIGCHA